MDMVRDCLQNTNEKGKKEIIELQEAISPQLARKIVKGYERLTTPALLQMIYKKAEEK